MSNTQLTATQQMQNALKLQSTQEKLTNAFNGDNKKIQAFQSALINIVSQEQLKNCSITSILQSAFQVATAGVDLNPLLGQAYIVSYKGKATPTISYRGWLKLLENTNTRAKANAVFNCDEFYIDYSDFEEKVHFIPNYDERKESRTDWFYSNFKGVLVRLQYADKTTKAVFVTADKLKKIQGISPSAKSNFSPYQNWAEEMFLAKALKYVLSKEPINDEKMANALSLDNETDKTIQQDTLQAYNKNKALEQDIFNKPQQVEQVQEVEVLEVE